MTIIHHEPLDTLEDAIGHDVNVQTYGIGDDPIGRITDVHPPETDKEFGDKNYPYTDIQYTVEDHFFDREWTTDHINFATIGTEYTVYYAEERTEDGWERITDYFQHRSDARSHLTHKHDTDAQTRVMTATYEVGSTATDKYPIRIKDGTLSIVPEGRNTLREALSCVQLDGRLTLYFPDQPTFDVTVTDIEPEEIAHDTQTSSSTKPDAVPDGYTITAEDLLGGTLTLTYVPMTHEADYVNVTRDAPSEPVEIPDRLDADEDPGDFKTRVRGISVGGAPIEHYNLPWMDGLRQRVRLPEEFNDSTANLGVVGYVWVGANDRFELYHASINAPFRKSNTPINELITADHPGTHYIDTEA